MDFLQSGVVTADQIKQAPILQLPSQVNIQCMQGQTILQPLQCCVQQPYTVQWFKDTTNLNSSKYEVMFQHCDLGRWTCLLMVYLNINTVKFSQLLQTMYKSTASCIIISY